MTVQHAAAIDVTPVELATATEIEKAEATAWADMYAAAPKEFAAAAGIGSQEIGGALVVRWAATGRRYFSRAIGLGIVNPATAADLDEILNTFEEAGINMFLLQSLPHCRPGEYTSWLSERGLQPFDAQDRIVRGDRPLTGTTSSPNGRQLAVEKVTPETADEWSEFLQRVYRLETGTWLPRLIGRPGWHQYVAREAGQVVAARGMYIGIDRTAWLGMDGPVPGITTDDYEPDAAVCATIVQDGLALGAKRFIADIEAPSPTMDTPAYEHFARLGFSRPYTRTHYATLP